MEQYRAWVQRANDRDAIELRLVRYRYPKDWSNECDQAVAVFEGGALVWLPYEDFNIIPATCAFPGESGRAVQEAFRDSDAPVLQRLTAIEKKLK